MSDRDDHMKAGQDLLRLDALIAGMEYSEEDLVQFLAVSVADMLEKEPDLLFSTLYRLDVAENRIREALDSPDELPTVALARVILERQKKRMETKKKYRSAAKYEEE